MIVGEYLMPTMVVRDHEIDAPLDWSNPRAPEKITVFARELVDPGRVNDDLPILLFLQGGPGGAGPRPTASGWWRTALKTHRVVLLDQRGTGRSSPINAKRMASFKDGREAAEYLALFRADSIVADAELLRSKEFAGKRWSTLGQSYGGFITLVYLSTAPDALEQCYVTGGLPGLRNDAGEVYRRTFPRMIERNAQYYKQFPDDEPIAAAIADLLIAGPVKLPHGDMLTYQRFQMLGMGFGMSNGFEELHWLLETALVGEGNSGGTLSKAFLRRAEATTGFDDNPLYMALQEAIYAQGDEVQGWAAERESKSHAVFGSGAKPVHFTGEVAYPWMFDEIQALRPFRAAVVELAARRDWPALYDLERLGANEVPVMAIQYFDDPYVDLDLALGTASFVGNTEVWVTNEYLHDGLRVAGERILPRLFRMGRGRS